MITLISTNNIPNPTDTLFFTDICCEYESIRFYLLISHLGITHLSFTCNYHRQAINKFKRIFPDSNEKKKVGKTSFCKDFFEGIISDQVVVTDFENNPFLKDATLFQKKIWQRICGIKAGETMTYGELAEDAGSPGGARAAGLACNKNPLPLIIPCHRVVAATGIGGFAADLSIKKRLLELEKGAGKS